MNSHNDLHLDEDQILHAVVDEAELSPTIREHLIACPRCNANKERFEQDLEHLGDLARHFSPLPKKRVSLPALNALISSGWSWKWRASLGAAMATALVIFVVWSTGLLTTTSQDNLDMVAGEVFQPDPVMKEIRMLTENVLPSVYQEISADYDSGLDEEFMQFVVPSMESESLSFEGGGKGVRLC